MKNMKKNKIETIRTVGEMIDFLSQFDRDMILSAEYAKMFGGQVIDYVVRPIVKDAFSIAEDNEIRLTHLVY